jgi:peptidoglycan/xylan/chitin deacetylase (PgdA/CDA1 family)
MFTTDRECVFDVGSKLYDYNFFSVALKTGPRVWEIGRDANVAFDKNIGEEDGCFNECLSMFTGIWNHIKSRLQRKAIILRYHQVCEKKADPWQFAVAPENFQYQLNHLKNNFDVVSVDELVTAIQSGKLTANLAAITFDDGFVDNYTNAAPLLEWFELPATFYLTSGAVRNPKLFWWDELQSIVLQAESLPKKLSIKTGTEDFNFEFRRDQVLRPSLTQEILNWSYLAPVKNERIDLYFKLCERIQPLQHLDQYTIMRSLRHWARLDNIPLGLNAPMQGHQVRKLGANKLFSLGGHSVNHAMLSAQTELVQSYEIKDCKIDIEEISGKEVKGFAYPYGKFNPCTTSLLQKNGYHYGLTTEERAVTVEADVYQLPRVQIKNWNEREFAFKLKQVINN